MKIYNLIKDVINSRNFKLEEMRTKVSKCYVTGDISEEEHTELLSLLSENVNPSAERPDWLAVSKMFSDRMTALEERVKALEQGDETTPENTNPYEKWNAWDGISDKYQLGAVVEHNGILYQSVYNGQNVWEPGAIGTETLWTIYENEDAV